MTAVAVCDAAAVISSLAALLRGNRLQRLLVYPAVYLSLYLTLTHLLAWLMP